MGENPAAIVEATEPVPGRPNRRGLRDLFFGDAFLGLWLIPLFVLVGLLGAGLAGVLVMLHYDQEIARLEAEAGAPGNSAARDQENSEDEDVDAADPAEFPYDDPSDAGVYQIRAQTPGEPSRVGSGFTVHSDTEKTFLVTTYDLVARTDSDRAVDEVDVVLPSGEVTGTVHNYDRRQDLAIVVVREGARDLPVASWGADAASLSAGDPLYLVGVSGQATEPIVEGTVSAATSRAVVPSMSVNSFLIGGALMDASGGVVAVASVEYDAPGESEEAYGVPIRVVCQRLLQCTGDDEDGDDAAGDSTGSEESGDAEGIDPEDGLGEPSA